MNRDHYGFKAENVADLRDIVPALIGVVKLGEPWGQRYKSMKVWRIQDKNYEFAGCMYYEYPRWNEQ